MSELTDVMLVDDDPDLLKATAQTLELAGFAVSRFSRAAAMLAKMHIDYPGVIVSDILMPEIDGLELLDLVRSRDQDIPVILMTGHGDIPMAVRAIQNGAYDFITKPFSPERLAQTVKRALETRRLQLENKALREAVDFAEEDLPLIGQTPAMERLRRIIRQIADTDVDVLITGETGSGKEVVANLLHRWSRRAKGHFVALNCGALPETVIESELFGHETGAFTGAQKKRVGRIEYSSGGTLFLDEIESMKLSTQVHMLRVLEGRVVSPLGSNEVKPVDLRVVAAAKKDLNEAAREGSFREDLYYRLNVVTISIPPLRDRRADVALLFNYFIQRASKRFGRETPSIPPQVQRHLETHHWPGNVRELAHYAERFVLGLAEDVGTASPTATPPSRSLPERLDEYEAQIIRDALKASDGDVRTTLEKLGIPRKTFYDKLQRHGIERAAYATTSRKSDVDFGKPDA
ncbi:sigma-54-dependent transcriptional regulator [Oryzifoliimicrobium ureilyticus]|uniref:sigma-54-dependent transcriptional regulator n=1 Tax=Oryzifoliimicrobium ureilyticus TaxID=3113724 RepID=UPI003076378E